MGRHAERAGRKARLPSHQEDLWPYLGRIIHKFVNTVKSVSSKWLRDNFRELQGFRWQSGYGGFSVDRRGDEALLDYIRNQERHHLEMSFQEECIRLLERFGIPYDERYVFD